MFVFQLSLQQLSHSDKAETKERWNSAEARLVEAHAVRHLTAVYTDDHHDGWFQVWLTLEDHISAQQFTILLSDISNALGIDVELLREHAQAPQDDRPVFGRIIHI